MLQTRTVEPRTLELLKRLVAIPILEPFFLVGGTALALQLGYRVSIDLDLFSVTDFDQDEPEILELYSQKFEHTTIFHVIKSLTYFDDAEEQPDPIVFEKKHTWEKVKTTLEKAAQKIYR